MILKRDPGDMRLQRPLYEVSTHVYALCSRKACVLYECEDKMRNNARMYGELTRDGRVQRTSCNIATSLLNQVIEPRDHDFYIILTHCDQIEFADNASV